MAEASSDFLKSDQLQRLLDEELTNELCPECDCSDKTKIKLVEIDNGALVIKICTNCNYSAGVDDSIDYSELRKQLEKCGIAKVARMKCKNCENCDVDQFSFFGFDDSGVLVRCLKCNESIMVNLQIFPTGHENAKIITEYEKQYSVDSDDEPCGIGGNDSVVSSLREHESCHEEQIDSASALYREEATDYSELNCYLCCDKCGKSDPAVFSPITVIENEGLFVECLNCNILHKLPKHSLDIEADINRSGRKSRPQKNVCRKADIPGGRTHVTDLKILKLGDHIEWHRDYIVYHHAIVESVNISKNQFTVIEYTGGSKKLNGSFASVRRNVINFNDPREDMMFVINYSKRCTLSTAETLRRARSRLGEANYGPLKNNCQHFATWCKTGRSVSDQVDTLKNRVIRTAGTTGVTVAEELGAAGIIAIARQIPLRQACDIARCGGLHHARACGEAVVKFSRNLKVGSMTLGIGINLAVEAASFGYFTYEAYCDYLDKKISREDFERIRMKLGFESVGGIIGGTVGGIVGQFIPIPVLGALLGCTLGSIIGRLIGAFLGKKCSELRFKT